MADSNFVDYVKINCRSGKGGKGSMHLRHVKYVEEASISAATITTGRCCT